MMKRMIAAAAVVGLLCSSAAQPMFPAAVTCYAEEAGSAEITENGLKYRIYEDHAEVIDHEQELTGDVIIPEEINGVPVTAIRYGTFNSCYDLSYVSIPSTVTDIDSNAFSWKSGLTYIDVAEGCTSYSDINGVLFNGDQTSLIRYPCERTDENYTIPDSVDYIYGDAFSYCTSLTSITIPDGVTSIGSSAFYDCSKLKSIMLPDGIQSIGVSTFAGCWSLASITIPDKVTYIGRSAFYNCRDLTNVTIPEGVNKIWENTFSECVSLKTVTIPDSVTAIGKEAFNECGSLTSVHIPNGVVEIPEKAFYNCKSLTEISIPDSVETIGMEAFSGCAGLKNIVIPEGITYIEFGTFSRCESLTSVKIPGTVFTVGEEAFCDCTSLTNIQIAEGVMAIFSSFRNCTSLKEITIPESVSFIGDFDGCTSLTDVTILNSECGMVQDETSLGSPYQTIIHGYEGSTAQRYAKGYGYAFVPINNMSEILHGDVNADGSLSVADVVLLQKWLLAVPDTYLPNWKAADLCEDDKLDVFDLCMMKRALLSNET